MREQPPAFTHAHKIYHDSRMRIAFSRELSCPLETPAREERLCIQEFYVALPSVLMHLEAVGSTVACPTRHTGIVGGKCDRWSRKHYIYTMVGHSFNLYTGPQRLSQTIY